MFIAPSLFFKNGASASPFHANATQWKASSGVLYKADVGIATQAAGTLSFWFRRQADNAGDYFFCDVSGSGKISAYMSGDTLTLIIGVTGSTDRRWAVADVNDTSWHHFVIAYDFSIAEGTTPSLLYLDGVSSYGSYSAPAGEASTVSIAAGGGLILNGTSTVAAANSCKADIAEFYWNYGSKLNIASAPNLAKFISAGKPVSLGATGSLPTGSQPLIYLPNAGTSLETNAGSWGNFTKVSTFVDALTSPSD